MDDTIFHDEGDIFNGFDRVDRIALNGDQIRPLADLYDAAIFESQKPGGDQRRALQRGAGRLDRGRARG